MADRRGVPVGPALSFSARAVPADTAPASPPSKARAAAAKRAAQALLADREWTSDRERRREEARAAAAVDGPRMNAWKAAHPDKPVPSPSAVLAWEKASRDGRQPTLAAWVRRRKRN